MANKRNTRKTVESIRHKDKRANIPTEELRDLASRESYLRKRILLYRVAGKRRWFVTARKKYAYTWQRGRFDGDVEFWKQGVSESGDVKPVRNGKSQQGAARSRDQGLSQAGRRGPLPVAQTRECRELFVQERAVVVAQAAAARVVRSKYSCGFPMIETEQPAKPSTGAYLALGLR